MRKERESLEMKRGKVAFRWKVAFKTPLRVIYKGLATQDRRLSFVQVYMEGVIILICINTKKEKQTVGPLVYLRLM